MIVVDNAGPASPLKSPGGSSSPTQPLVSPPPPPYQNQRPPPGPSGQVMYQPVHPSTARPEPAGRRFLKAFGLALLIYALCSALIGSFFAPEIIRFKWGPPVEPSAADGNPINCHLPFEPYTNIPVGNLPALRSMVSHKTDWDDAWSPIPSFYPPYSAKTTFTLPSNVPLLYFLSKGSFASGNIRFVYSEEEGSDEERPVQGEIVTRYWSLAARNNVNICTLSKEEGSYGLGIYTARGWPTPERDVLHFEVTITLPKPSASHPGPRGLQTKLPLFAHDIGDLGSHFVFHTIDFSSTNSAIRAKSLRAKSIEATTTNSPISGSFNATSFLLLATSNGYIDVDIGASNEDWHKPTSINLITSNARIEADIVLTSSTKTDGDPAAPGFSINPTTSNGRLHIAIPSAPVGSHINVGARTSNAAAWLGLPPAYEGKVALSTYNGVVNVIPHPNTEDPSGHGHSRTWKIDKAMMGRVVEGRVWWGPEKDHRELGYAEVRTSNAQNIVELL
ncbi:hypothetical protein FRB99_005470 [Tulasnella sp. 403]|nr:hypothetical protein FRB99_005470 [Tulasnella sp. 403]